MPRESVLKRDIRFPGNSEEFKHFLERKKTNLKFIYGVSKSKSERSKIKSYMDKIDYVLELDYFEKCEKMSMSRLIERIKEDRNALDKELKSLKPKLDSAEKALSQAFDKAGGYIANIYEDEYNTHEQEELRELYDDYDALKCEYYSIELPWRIRWWLLGMINRPNGFFANAVK